MKVIFLDIDGVLNYEKCSYKIGQMYFVDDEKISLLKRIIEATGAQIVLSSTWRYGWIEMDLYDNSSKNIMDFKALRDRLLESGITMISRTPDCSWCRGEEIKEFLDNWSGEPIDKFIVLDDGKDMEPFMDRLVQTSWKTGLTEKNVELAIKLLNE